MKKRMTENEVEELSIELIKQINKVIDEFHDAHDDDTYPQSDFFHLYVNSLYNLFRSVLIEYLEKLKLKESVEKLIDPILYDVLKLKQEALKSKKS